MHYLFGLVLWPIIVSSFYLNIRKKQIISKRKYFLLSTIGGYILFIGFNFLLSFLARNFVDINNDVGVQILLYATPIFLYIPPIILSHILSKRIDNKT